MSKATAQAIANALGDGVAPTPQNTPLQATPGGLSRPHIPTTIGEDDDEVEDTISSNQARDDIRGALANNPLLAQMVQGQLTKLIGKSSGYIESLSPIVRQRVEGLKGLQLEHTKIEAEFQKEILELEKRFAEKYRPIYERRRNIIEGATEPTEDEIKKGYKVDADEDDEDEDEEEPTILTGAEAEGGEKGIPQFWLTALSNHAGISELITERDEEALKHLVDVRVEYLESGKPGFKLLFEFGEGRKEFFEDKILTKTYYYQEEVGSLGDFVYDHAEGTEIKWKTGKDLTVRVETKKQRNKIADGYARADTNQTRTVKKVVPTDSFFTFFKPPTPPAEDEDESAVEDDLDEKLEFDYQIGEDIKDRIVPHAIDYFTGKALQSELDENAFDSDEFDDDDDADDLDDDDDDEEVTGGRAIKGARKAAEPPTSGVTPGSQQNPQECKNQ
ncbi:histone chaperone [Cystobasidiomycetes sp. EMM_F5]